LWRTARSIPKTPDRLGYFSDLEEPRLDRTKRHQFLDLVFIAVCATIAGANDFVAMEKFGTSKRAWLSKFLELPNGIPSHDTFGRVLAAIDPHAFTECFLRWVRALRQTTAGQFVGIDGKTARASGDRAQGQNPLHVVSAWASANQLVLGQVAVDEKSNEITAIPTLLEMLELQGALVTIIDAMGCQKEIVRQIRAQGAAYVLPVKGNQEHLEEDIVNHFARLDEQPHGRAKVSVCETAEKGHGREESRC
jgi:predicted transposase YbfD/YdcC